MNKPDTWYVQKGVELADGWLAYDSFFAWPHSHHECHPYDQDALPSHILDALAAQLARQSEWTDNCAELNIRTGEVELLRCDFKCFLICGPDRTMNTIRCIVDSKVLEGE